MNVIYVLFYLGVLSLPSNIHYWGEYPTLRDCERVARVVISANNGGLMPEEVREEAKDKTICVAVATKNPK